MSIKIFLADDHKIVRDGLRSLLEKQPDMEVVAEAEDGRTTVRQVQKLLPDVVIMDISMHDLNGIEATRQIIAKSPRIKVLALSMHSDKRFIAGILSAGASGYLIKDSTFKELINAIRAVVSDQIYLSPRIAGIVTEDYVNYLTATDSSASSILTVREREILQLLAEGKTTKQVASQLHVSVKTIETHRHRIMDKLGIYSIAELTKYAVREGLTSL
ncbi:MAG: DNA-binding response regulator [Candidatus Scalindua rubra]|uniref:DNA-binding response regulator n=1 Tax=Candidatus Scalindua rubra TaxID=1872076 RepID=A0A1E3XIR9_9BACT|nr:MAG: DNA-binding response regulator [Candidatus Scalindua rubra]